MFVALLVIPLHIYIYGRRVSFQENGASLQREKERTFMQAHNQDILVYEEGHSESSRTKIDVLLMYGLTGCSVW